MATQWELRKSTSPCLISKVNVTQSFYFYWGRQYTKCHQAHPPSHGLLASCQTGHSMWDWAELSLIWWCVVQELHWRQWSLHPFHLLRLRPSVHLQEIVTMGVVSPYWSGYSSRGMWGERASRAQIFSVVHVIDPVPVSLALSSCLFIRFWFYWCKHNGFQNGFCWNSHSKELQLASWISSLIS